jgi:nucleotide-binding universal stress UspA family protein
MGMSAPNPGSLKPRGVHCFSEAADAAPQRKPGTGWRCVKQATGGPTTTIEEKTRMNYNRILVPIDFSADSLSAYQVALTHFAGQDKTLILLHVIEHGLTDIDPIQQVRANFIEETKRKLTTLGNSRKGDWKEVDTLIESGRPTDLIILTAKQTNADLVILGCHGTGGVTQGLFGSTTYDVARKVKCSVMISKRN